MQAAVTTFSPRFCSYTTKDAIVYALGIGCSELKYTFEDCEDGFEIFPTFPLVLPFIGEHGADVQPFPPPGMALLPPSLGNLVSPLQVLHGEQSIEWHGDAIPPGGGIFRADSTLVGAQLKGKSGCLMTVETVITCLSSDRPMATLCSGSYLKNLSKEAVSALRSMSPTGASSVHQSRAAMPSSSPDGTVRLTVAANQALLYRLSGDYNPLHVDSKCSEALGLGNKPFLHGLCTLGFACRSLLLHEHGRSGAQCRLQRLTARFVSPAFPGDDLETQLWHGGNGTVQFRVVALSRQVVVVDFGAATFTTVVPQSRL